LRKLFQRCLNRRLGLGVDALVASSSTITGGFGVRARDRHPLLLRRLRNR